MQAQATHNVPYQGFPYSSPPVHDAPTVAPGAAARWQHLPRRQVAPPVHRTQPRVTPTSLHAGGSSAALPRKPAAGEDPAPVVYIDMPDAGGSSVSTLDRPPDDDTREQSVESKREVGDVPEAVVYIDLPDTGDSDLTAAAHTRPETDYTQETIFFNPFESRRMQHKHVDTDTESSSGTPRPRPHPHPHRAAPPRANTLALHGAGASGAGSSGAGSSAGSSTPDLASKQTMVYGECFPVSPIPVSEFPEPPPSYADIDRESSPVVTQEAVSEHPRPQEPPRTQVILPPEGANLPLGLPNSERKYLNCHHCGLRVHSLVIRENGSITHFIALMCLLVCMLPCVGFIYCTDTLKIKNHYCPSCNKIIGYEQPFGRKKIVYVN